jgi:hypothetical protein
MKTPSKMLAASILAGAIRSTPEDDVERTKRIAIAQLYRRLRMARDLRIKAVAQNGLESLHANTCRVSEAEAWNSLQVMKAVLWPA